MKTSIVLLISLALISAMHPMVGHHEREFVAKKQVLQPHPNTMEEGTQKYFLSHELTFEVNSSERELDADVLNRFHLIHQKKAQVNHNQVIHAVLINTSGKIVTPEKPEDEAFELIVDEGQVIINAQTQNGVAHAITKFIQLLETEQHESGDILYSIPNYPLRMTGSPKFSYRGLLIDTSRHFFPVVSIQQVMGWMSEVSLNILHLHLTDSQSWPVEIDAIPELTQYGAYKFGEKAAKTYTRADIQAIVKFGAAIGISVIPEIDCPAHAPINFGIEAFSELFDGAIVQCQELKYDNPTYSAEMPSGQWNMTNPKTAQMLETVWSQLNEDFTSDIAHLGMDELNKNCACVGTPAEGGTAAECLAQVTQDFQNFANEVIAKVATASGKKVMVWQDSVIEYGVTLADPANSIVQLWNWIPTDVHQQEAVIKMCNEGVKFVYSQWDTYYLDCGGTNSCLASLTWCPYVTWYDIYVKDILDVPEECKDSIIGAEATAWSEMINSYNIGQKLLPRIWAEAEKLWNNPPSAPKAASLEGAKIWVEYLPTIRAKTQQYIDWSLPVRPLNTEYCFVNEAQAEICTHWTMSFYESLDAIEKQKCELSEGKVRNENGECVQCGDGTFAHQHGMSCQSCKGGALGSAHCCNENGTVESCSVGTCENGKFCSAH